MASQQVHIRIFHPMRYYKIAVTVVLALITMGLFSRGYFKTAKTLHVGDIAAENISATKTLNYENKKETERLRQSVIDSLPPVFLIRNDVYTQATNQVHMLFRELKAIEAREGRGGGYRKFISDMQLQISYETYVNMQKYYRGSAYEAKLMALLESVYAYGVLSRTNISETTLFRMRNGIALYKDTDKEYSTATVDLDAVYFLENLGSMQQFVSKRYSYLSPEKINALSELLSALVKENLVYDDVLMEKRIAAAAGKIKPVINTIKKGYTIISKGEIITEEKAELVNALSKGTSLYTMRMFIVDLLFIAILGFLAIAYLHRYMPKLMREMRELSLIAIEYFISALFTYIVYFYIMPSVNAPFISTPLPVYLIAWIPVFAIINSLLMGRSSGIFISFVGSFIAVAVTGGSLFDVFILTAACMVTLFVTDKIRRRNDILIASLLAGAVLALGVIIDGTRNDSSAVYILFGVGFALLAGVVQGVIATGLLSALEHFLNTATIFRLLELSDLNAPLLRKLQLLAPGTYHHSYILSNMVEEACEVIGANALLARVGAYYHDIGKMENPPYYIENSTVKDNKHKNIKASLSASIIKSHTRIGVELAIANGLPEEIIGFIQEHHGTSMIKYFYHQAVRQGGNADRDVFSYPGPKPQSKESGVLMLADSIEAASRAIPSPNGDKIEEMVRSVINEKIKDRELEESGLTLHDISLIEQTFVKVLMTSFHGRIEYPKETPVAVNAETEPAAESAQEPSRS